MRVRYILLLLFLAFTAYLLFYPTGKVFPYAHLEKTPPFEGPLAVNEHLDNIPILGTVGDAPEDVAIDQAGTLYTGIEDGHIMTFTRGAKTWTPITLTYGRPLGLAFSPDDKWLYIADAEKGLMRTDKQGHLERIIDTLNGEDLGFVDDLAVAENGNVYFTTASTQFDWQHTADALLVHQGTGKLLMYAPSAKRLTVLIDSLQFANGVAISEDQQTVYVAETGNYKVLAYTLKDNRVSVFAENLPGFPDGLNFDEDGLLWVSIPSRRNEALDLLLDKPFLREVVYKLPSGFKPQPERYGLVIALNGEGEIVESLHGPDGNYAGITNVQWRGDTMYTASLLERSIGRVVRP